MPGKILLSGKWEFKGRISASELVRGMALKKVNPVKKYLLLRSGFLTLSIYSVEPSNWWLKLTRANDITDSCMRGSQGEAEEYFRNMGYRLNEVRYMGRR